MRHAAPSILALDLGTECGWAIVVQGVVVSGTFDTRAMGGDDLGVRFLRFRRELLNNFRGVREVYYELVRRHEGTHAAHVYGGFEGILLSWCKEHDIPVKGLEVAEIKKHATGKGNSRKSVMLQAMRDKGFTPEDDNEADALAILSLARKLRSATE